MVSTDQLRMIAFPKAPAPGVGMSYVTAVLKAWRTSKSDEPRSRFALSGVLPLAESFDAMSIECAQV